MVREKTQSEVGSEGTQTSGRKMKKVETTFVKIGKDEDEVKELEGVLLEKSTQSFPNGLVGRYLVENDNHSEFTFIGSTVIDDLMRRVPEGTFFKLAYTGQVKSNNGRMVNQFSLEIEEA